MNNLDRQYQDLLQDILNNGVKKEDRTGTGTISVFGRQIRHKMSEGFPLLTTKKMPFKTIVTELLWFLRGDTNIKYLVDNGCHIWDGDAYKNYEKTAKVSIDRATAEGILKGGPDDEYSILTMEGFVQRIKTDAEFAKKWGELGPIYGKQWRKWKTKEYPNNEPADYSYVDQIANLINDLKTNPDSRRLMVNAWNVGELDQMVLPPCHYGFQVYTRPTTREEKIVNPGKYRAISLMWNQRSVDTFLGLPFNIASYGLLLEIIAKEVNMVPDELIGNLGDVHLYSNHIEQAKEQIGRELTWEEKIQWVMKNTDVEMENLYITEAAAALEATTRWPYPLPNLIINDEFWNPDAGIFDQINHIEVNDFMVDNYQSHPAIKAPLSN